MAIIERYAYIWTTHAHEYTLWAGEFKGEKEYTIVHHPTRTALLIEDEELHAMVVHKMMENGIQTVTEYNPFEQ